LITGATRTAKTSLPLPPPLPPLMLCNCNSNLTLCNGNSNLRKRCEVPLSEELSKAARSVVTQQRRCWQRGVHGLLTLVVFGADSATMQRLH
jgi:hypothetical protein